MRSRVALISFAVTMFSNTRQIIFRQVLTACVKLWHPLIMNTVITLYICATGYMAVVALIVMTRRGAA